MFSLTVCLNRILHFQIHKHFSGMQIIGNWNDTHNWCCAFFVLQLHEHWFGLVMHLQFPKVDFHKLLWLRRLLYPSLNRKLKSIFHLFIQLRSDWQCFKNSLSIRVHTMQVFFLASSSQSVSTQIQSHDIQWISPMKSDKCYAYFCNRIFETIRRRVHVELYGVKGIPIYGKNKCCANGIFIFYGTIAIIFRLCKSGECMKCAKPSTITIYHHEWQ